MKVLIVVDMQNDFVDGALGSNEAVKIVDRVVAKVKNFDGKVIFTRDTHYDNYLETSEGKKLPVKHCIENTHGWEIIDSLKPFVKQVINKPTFGSIELSKLMTTLNNQESIDSIELIGLCTDICVISNAEILKATLYETPIIVDAACCAGVTVESHNNALNAMEATQINVINR
ncbi:MAG: cysteine hydrolase [Thomasclavelia sp.]|nr:cysteine hydrolase [Thomasclavelia sp.]